MSGTGEASYGDPVDTKCYRNGKIEIITDAKGREVVSNLQVYLDGSTIIKEQDKIVFDKEHDIKALSPFYDGNTGIVSLWVVYL